jgi:hypothetical protein
MQLIFDLLANHEQPKDERVSQETGREIINATGKRS